MKYTELLRLPYYDPIKCHVIHVMHNLLLGSAKKVFECWIEKGILKEKDLEEIGQLIQEVPVPSNVGRVAGSILINFKSFKAEELKNWVLYFSLYCLKDLISLNHFNMWQIFVRSCHKLLKPTISIQEIDDAHNFLVLFVEKFAELFGKEHVTPNMHMYLHLKNCLKKFGPVYGFWCFSFERYNGILESFCTNNHSISVQLMKKFISGIYIESSYKNLGIGKLPTFSEMKLSSDHKEVNSKFYTIDRIRRNIKNENIPVFEKCYDIIAVPKMDTLSNEEMDILKENIQQYIPLKQVHRASTFMHTYDRITLGRDVISSNTYKRGSSKDNSLFALRIELNGEKVIRPGIVKKIFQVRVAMTDKPYELVCISLDWLTKHPRKTYYGIYSPLQIWDAIYDNDGASMFLPIHAIFKKCCIAKNKVVFTREYLAGKWVKIREIDVVNFVF